MTAESRPDGRRLPADRAEHPSQPLAALGLRRLLSRTVLVATLAGSAYLVYAGASGILQARGIGTGFSFLSNEAGFAIGEKMPIPILGGQAAGFASLLCVVGLGGLLAKVAASGLSSWQNRALTWWVLSCLALLCILLLTRLAQLDWAVYSPDDSFAFALLTGFANTLKVSFFGCILATVVGITVGLARLSTNWLVRNSATVFIETLRNVPLLIQIFFWYFGVIRALPPVRDSISVLGVAELNNRGIYLPKVDLTPAAWAFFCALLAGIGVYRLLSRLALSRKLATGESARWRRVGALLPVLLPAGAWMMLGAPLELGYPVRTGFNFTGGFVVTPEFSALLIGISLYSASFIAEIVRSGIQGVDAGQREAARALGLGEGRIMRLVIFPQALAVMFPPLITQYLSLIKDSSLGFAIAYPELVSINNVMINQTGQPIEILAITISVFVLLNILVTLVLNRFEQAHIWAKR